MEKPKFPDNCPDPGSEQEISEALEEKIASYEYEIVKGSQGQILAKNPPTEEYMQSQTITSKIREEMKAYRAKEYRSVGSAQADLLAHAILNNWGGVGGARGDNEGWRQYPVLPPQKPGGDWGHAFYWTGFGLDTQGKFFKFLNSWGNGWGKIGRGKMYFDQYDMPTNTFGIWTLVDLPNQIINLANMKAIKTADGPQIYLLEHEGKHKLMVIDMPTLEALHVPFEIVSQEELDKIPTKGTIVWTERIIN